MADGVAVGRPEDFTFDRFTLVEVDGRSVGVLRLADAEFRAVLNVCPHRRGPVCRGRLGGTWPPSAPGTLEFGLDGRVLQCPWHGWEFDLNTGRALFGVSSSRLQIFPAWMEDGQVMIGRRPLPASALSDGAGLRSPVAAQSR